MIHIRFDLKNIEVPDLHQKIVAFAKNYPQFTFDFFYEDYKISLIFSKDLLGIGTFILKAFQKNKYGQYHNFDLKPIIKPSLQDSKYLISFSTLSLRYNDSNDIDDLIVVINSFFKFKKLLMFQ